MSFFANILGHGKSTLVGLLTGLGAAASAGVAGAAMQFSSNPQVASWTPYAVAAAAAAVPAFVGAFSKDAPPAPAYSAQARQVAEAVDQASQEYAARKADEVIKNLQQQLKQVEQQAQAG